MTPKQFNDAALQLFGSVYACATPLGISLRQAQRYATGEADQVVAQPVANQLRYLLGHVATLKVRRRELRKMVEWYGETGARVLIKTRDVTAAQVGWLKAQLEDVEASLRFPGEGMVPQI